MIAKIKRSHEVDHIKSNAIYETRRMSFFSGDERKYQTSLRAEYGVYEVSSCCGFAKNERTRRPIPAPYPNSRWQIDLNRMPPTRGIAITIALVFPRRFIIPHATKLKSLSVFVL